MTWKKMASKLLILGGLCLLLYPFVSDRWNFLHSSRVVADYTAEVDRMEEERLEQIWRSAHIYNAWLRDEAADRFHPDDAELARYYRELDVTGTGIMGYLEIPKISVKLPVYHGVDEGVMQIAAGHMPGSSLPVGGPGTHAVLSGHRGLPSAKLFTALDEMGIGDTFSLHVLNRTLTYRVDQCAVVLPDDSNHLGIEADRDYCTLVTCTPYGVNSHRLLVRGVRETQKE